jgi:hypothetical protein
VQLWKANNVAERGKIREVGILRGLNRELERGCFAIQTVCSLERKAEVAAGDGFFQVLILRLRSVSLHVPTNLDSSASDAANLRSSCRLRRTKVNVDLRNSP